MNSFRKGVERIGGTVLVFLEGMSYIHTFARQWRRIVHNSFEIGYKTLFIVGIMSLFIGGVLALQTGFSLKSVSGAQSFLGSIVGLSMCRELGPVITAFLVAGRIGSATTAELASMRVYQEIEALVTMNLSPQRILVFPRLMAIIFMMPALTIFSIVIGWFGGMLVSEYVGFINLEPETYWQSLREHVKFESVKDGLIKAEIFGIVIVSICCNEGLSTQGGPREIGYSVTRAVVGSMMTILILDYFVTKITL